MHNKSLQIRGKKIMKKIISAILVAIMVLSLAACGNGGSNGKTLKVATSPDFAPFEFVDASKTGQDAYVGFDLSLAHFIADELGMKLEVMPMSFDACQVAVELGNVDMAISGFVWSEKREENYNLSDFYFVGTDGIQTLIVPKTAEGTYTGLDQFSGKKVAAQDASLQFDLCNAQLPADCEVVEIIDINTAILQLINGDFDAIAVPGSVGETLINSHKEELGFCGVNFVVDPKQDANVILLQKGNDELTQKVNAVLAKASEAGYYVTWEQEAKELAGTGNAQEVTYDDEGKVAQ